MKLRDIKIIRKETQQTTQWSGGTTTQLYIYPQGAEYTKRDFLFRISTATTETETSTFTKLPGIQRILLLLKGTLTITHKHQYTKTLQPLETDAFDGDWETTAVGKVTDFNMLFKPSVDTQVNVKHILATQCETIPNNGNYNFGYLYAGSCIIEQANTTQVIHQGDFVVFNPHHSYTITAIQNCCLIVTEVIMQ